MFALRIKNVTVNVPIISVHTSKIFLNVFIWSPHDIDSEFNCCVDVIKMIKDVGTDEKCDSMSSLICTIIQRMFNRKRWHITTYYKYCSHRLFYVHLLLIYSYIFSHAIVLAESTIHQIKTSASDTKTSNEIDRTVTAVKLEEFEDEYFDDDQDDREYRELVSNKSGEYFCVVCIC